MCGLYGCCRNPHRKASSGAQHPWGDTRAGQGLPHHWGLGRLRRLRDGRGGARLPLEGWLLCSLPMGQVPLHSCFPPPTQQTLVSLGPVQDRGRFFPGKDLGDSRLPPPRPTVSMAFWPGCFLGRAGTWEELQSSLAW